MKVRCEIWQYGVSVWMFGRWFYLSYNPDYEQLFSERYGYTKVHRLFGFVFKKAKRKI